MNSVTRLLSIFGLALAGTLASSAPALADHSGIGVSIYGGSRNHGYALSWQDSNRGHRDYRSDYGNDYHYDRYNRPHANQQRDPWCPTHSLYHNHSYGYYGFNGGYYGVYDGNSHEEVFSRAYDDGYSDGYNTRRNQLQGGTRAYRKGYEQGYRDGRRDGRNVGRRDSYR